MPDVFTQWGFWYVVGGAIVLVAAVLLVTILVLARGIAAEAVRALEACRVAERNTRSIRELAGARESMEAIRDRAGGVAATAGALAESLHGEAGARRLER